MVSHTEVSKRIEDWKKSLVEVIQQKTLSTEKLEGIQLALSEFEKKFEGVNMQGGVWEISVGHPHPHPRSRSYRAEPHDWHVEDQTPSEILSKINALQLKNIETKSPLRSAVIFDLDGTLFDVSYRTLGILRRWLLSPEGTSTDNKLRTRIGKISRDHIGYSLAHAFENAGLDLRDHSTCGAFLHAEKYWRQKFFDGKSLLEFDLPTEGSLEFVKKVELMGCKIIYLTGRDEKVMRQGTIEQLSKNKFPLNDCEFILKKVSNQDDHEFKKEAFQTLTTKFNVIGNFENEYLNIREMSLIQPQCIHTILDSQHSGRPVETLQHKVYRLKDFSHDN
jgi:HAD superfamily, subfamily IIIB (Acid phosphatase)